MIRSVTLDLDGTLLDTLPDLAAAANAMRRELGCEPLAEERIASYVGRGIEVLVERCLPDLTGEPLTLARQLFRRHYARENGRRTRVYPGVAEGLDALRRAGLPLAVITNKAAAFSEPLLAATGLAPYFRFVISGDSVAHKKPHPLPLLAACARLGVTPEENLHIGDSANDVAAARAAGCPVWLLPYGYNEGRRVQESDADVIVSSLLDAAQHIASTSSTAPRAVSPAPTF
ncbi:MAG: phosphoglycolate phosphatase [Betaproteobacteria bacterium HGW-Betaproteobacteria-11]|nr:MAG: phosphoglycolate phosphatase [Betaproteobacteria bacterium HGW-Betaproteobacteria-11]